MRTNDNMPTGVNLIAEILTESLSAVRSGPRDVERVLIVDNEVTTLARLSETLLSRGYEIATTTDGEEAMRMMQAKPFH